MRLVATLLAAVAAVLVGAADAHAGFHPIDVYIDAGRAGLAAYQVEVVAKNAVIVGVEGGSHPAFREPAYYDPAALAGGRIILAAFSTDEVLPSGATRVATIHMREAAGVHYEVRLMAAADAEGRRIAAAVKLGTRE